MIEANLKAGLVIHFTVEEVKKSFSLYVGDIVNELQYKDGENVSTIDGRVKDIIVIDTMDGEEDKKTESSNGCVANCPYSNLYCQSTGESGVLYRGVTLNDPVYNIATKALTTSDPVHNDCAVRDYYTTLDNTEILYPSANPLNVDKEGIYPDLPHLVSNSGSDSDTGVEVSLNDLFRKRYVPKYLLIDASSEFNCNILKIELSSIIDILTVKHAECQYC